MDLEATGVLAQEVKAGRQAAVFLALVFISGHLLEGTVPRCSQAFLPWLLLSGNTLTDVLRVVSSTWFQILSG